MPLLDASYRRKEKRFRPTEGNENALPSPCTLRLPFRPVTEIRANPDVGWGTLLSRGSPT